MRWTVVAAAAGMAVATLGCGSERSTTGAPAGAAEQPVVAQKRVKTPGCAPSGEVAGGPLTVCGPSLNGKGHGRFEVGGRRLPVRYPFAQVPAKSRAGSWVWAAPSPDGELILAQWSGECEIPDAFLIPAAGGTPRLVSGDAATDARRPNTSALGWTKDGRAIVFFPAEPGCGSERETGTFLIDPAGGSKQIAPAKPRQPPALERSLHPRSVAALRRALG